MIKNQWELRKGNQTSQMIKQFMRFCKCETPEELLNLSTDETNRLVNLYLHDILCENADSTVVQKMRAIQLFFKVNGFDLPLKGHPFDIPVVETIVISPI